MGKVLTLAVFAIFLSGCLVLDGNEPPDVDEKLTVLGLNDPWPKLDAFQLLEASIEGDILTVGVAYPGGCKEHAFTYFTNGPVLKTNPPGADIIIRHDKNGEECEAFISQDLTIDLTPIRADGYDTVLVHVQEYDFSDFTALEYSY